MFVLAVTAPKLFPLWSIKTAILSMLSQFAVVKFDTDVLTGLVLAAGYVRDALRTVEDEQEVVESERDAFLEFAEGVQSLPAATQPARGVTTAHVAHMGTDERALEQVRSRYRETVMAVPDYDQEYGEPFDEHLAAEFGSDVASVVLDGHQFNEPVKQLLVEQSRQSAQQRERLLEGFAVEERSLCRSNLELEPVASFLEEVDGPALETREFDELVETDDDVRRHRARCESVLERRQEEVHTTNRRVGGATEMFLQEYLYKNLPVSFPVLHTGLEYIRELDARRSALVRTLCRRI